MTGTRVGQWILGPEVGRGPVGTVYRAAHAADPAKVAAVKVLHPEVAHSAEFKEKFVAEMLILHRLNHPNIAKFFDSGIHAGSAYYAGEFVEGVPLGDFCKAARKPDEAGANWKSHGLSLAVQAARALKHGHHRSILHRGLKPANVLVQADGVLKLTDFGIGRLFLAAPLSLPAEPTGTACFLAPEYFIGKPLTRRSDLYSLGGVLYAMLCGRPPFAAATAAEFMHKHCYVLPDRPVRFVPTLPPDFDELVCDLLRKDPGRRPASAPAVLEELDRIRGKAERKGERVAWPPEGEGSGTMAALPAEAPAGAGADPLSPRPLMSRPAVVIPLLLAVLALGAAAYFRPQPDADALFAAAQPLLASENPADWDRAWDDYLQPLSEKYPQAHADEVNAARLRIADRKRLKRALDDAGKVRAGSEAERLYARGLALLQGGDADQAVQTWQALAALYGGTPAEERWCRLSASALAELAKKNPPRDPRRQQAKQETLDRIRSLRMEGKGAEADAMLAAYERLYRGEDDGGAKPRD